MISYQSVVAVFAMVALANAAAVSSSVIQESPTASVAFYETLSPSPSVASSALGTPVVGSAESSVLSPITSVLGSVVFLSATPSPITEPISSTVTATSPAVATSTAVFTFTYVPVETVTVTEYRCVKETTSLVRPTTTTASPVTITESTRVITSVLPSVTVSELGTTSAFGGPFPLTTVVSSVGFTEPTTSFAS